MAKIVESLTRAGAEDTATGGFGGGKDIGGGAGSTTNEQGFTSGGQFSGLKKGGLAGILYG